MITTVTLNASIDKAYYLKNELKDGEVMRVAECINTAGGKGLNVARVAKLLGEDVSATGFVGGHTGAYLEELLEQDGLNNQFVRIKAETRCCINILDTKVGSTEFLEPGAAVESEDIPNFLMKFQEIVKTSDIITISGSIPKGVETDIYAKMIQIARKDGKQVILDTSGATLAEGIKVKPTMIKPNNEELEALLGTPIKTREQLIDAAKKLQQSGIPLVVVSMGAEGALLVCDEGVFQGKAPDLQVVNTVGCGDSMVAAFAVALKRKMSKQECLKYAIAVSSANAMNPQTGYVDIKVMEDILKQVEIITY